MTTESFVAGHRNHAITQPEKVTSSSTYYRAQYLNWDNQTLRNQHMQDL